MKKLLPALLLITSSYLLPGYIHAQTPSPEVATSSVIVSPPNFIFDAKPGETIQKTIKVTNPSRERELVLQASVSDFIVTDDQGTPVKVDSQESGRFMASTWFTIEQDQLVLAAGEQRSLLILITVPDDALPGGHYAGIYFQPIIDRSAKDTVSYTALEVGSLFDITVPGDIKYDAVIKEFQSSKDIYEFGPVDFHAVIENQSDTHIRPQSSVIIKDMLGREMARVQLNELNIFPFTSRSLDGKWDQVWGLGRYTATLTATYGPGMVAERTIFFWIMPWKIIAAILILLAVILVVIISARRHLNYRQDRRDAEIDELKRKIVELENAKRR